jgi:hypothetical protein
MKISDVYRDCQESMLISMHIFHANNLVRSASSRGCLLYSFELPLKRINQYVAVEN